MSTAAPPGQASPARVRPVGEPQGAALEEQKRSFLRMVSHELRTPLNSILGFSEILATQLYGPLGDERYRQYAEVIRESGEKLLKLVNQVLEIARLQGGDLDLDLRPEPIGLALDEQLAAVRAELAARQLRVVASGCADAVAIADARGLRTILGCLLSNAVAFAPEGGEIRIFAQPHERELEIVVANDGEGVAADDAERLLRPFEQGQNALTRHGEGAGLGLAICDLACRAMSGRIALVSAPGQGFSAHVILPLS